jgi:hypothetical protein
MVGPGMFDGMLTALLLIGALLGLAFASLIWLAYWLWCHIDIVWIP